MAGTAGSPGEFQGSDYFPFTEEVKLLREEYEQMLKKPVFNVIWEPFDMGVKEFHPHNLLFSQHRQQMFYSFKLGGAPGLAEYLYRYAWDKELGGETMYKYFSQDKRSPRPALAFLLSTIHPRLIEALILNNLSHKEAHDPKFASLVAQTTVRGNTVGIYLNQWADRGRDPQANTQQVKDRRAYRGCGLSLNELIKLKEQIRLYKGNPNDSAAKKAESFRYAKLIDYQINPSNSKDYDAYDVDTTWRRYARNDNQRNVLERFCRAIENELEKKATDLDDKLKDEPTRWGTLSVGYGAQCFDRSLAHPANSSTSALFGVTNAILNFEFQGKFEINQYQILYLTHRDHRNLGEAAISVLTNSYADTLGMNGKLAGAIGGDSAGDVRGYQTNIEWLFRGGRTASGIRGAIDDNPRGRGWRASLEYNERKLKNAVEWADIEANNKIDVMERENDRRKRALGKLLRENEHMSFATDITLGLAKIRRILKKAQENDPNFQNKDVV